MTRAAVVVDDRYAGNHGIARYAREVVSRLDLPWTPLGSGGSPNDIGDIFNRARRRLGGGTLLYSPGFASGPSDALQLVTLHDLTHIKEERGLRTQLHRLYYERVLRPIVRRSGHVMTVSGFAADEVRDWLRDDRVQIHDAGNGCSPVFTLDGPRTVRDRPYFLFVGNLKPHKNPRPAFAAMATLAEHDLVVVSGDHGGVMAMAAEYGIADRVEVRSEVADEELAALYRGAEALVFPSVMEGFGLPVVEAWRCGTPVVHYAGCAAVAEICGDRQFAVPSIDDPEAYAVAMRRAAGSGVSDEGLAGYDWSDVATRVRQTIEHVMAERGMVP